MVRKYLDNFLRENNPAANNSSLQDGMPFLALLGLMVLDDVLTM